MVSLSLKQWETMLVVSSWVLSLVPGDCGEDVELAGCMNTDWRLILLLKLLLTLCDILLADPCTSLEIASDHNHQKISNYTPTTTYLCITFLVSSLNPLNMKK